MSIVSPAATLCFEQYPSMYAARTLVVFCKRDAGELPVAGPWFGVLAADQIGIALGGEERVRADKGDDQQHEFKRPCYR